MKYLLRVLFILALFCGITSMAHADNFHVQVLDPDCVTNPDAACTIHAPDLGVPFGINLTASTCTDQDVTGLPAGVPFGCFVGTNDTGAVLTSVTLLFGDSHLDGDSCDTDLFGTQPPAAFSNSGCTESDSGFALTFTDGSINNSRQFVIVESGENPDFFDGFATVTATPEPDSLLLLSTGAMMMTAGLLVNKRRRFAFLKK